MELRDQEVTASQHRDLLLQTSFYKGFIKLVTSNPTVDYIAGGVGGLCGLVLGHPTDTMKVLVQTSFKPSKSVLKRVLLDGRVAMFRGLSVPVFNYGVANYFYFGCYSQAETSISQMSSYDPDNTTHEVLKLTVAGVAGGLGQLPVFVPAELLKCRMQAEALSSGARTTTARHHIRCVLKESGIRGLYKGTCNLALRESIFGAVSFTLYGLGMRVLQKDLHWGVLGSSLLAGGVSGALAWLITMPIDVIKTRVQTGLDVNCRQSLRFLLKQGPHALFKGTNFAVVSAFCVYSVTFAGYEFCRDFLLSRAP